MRVDVTQNAQDGLNSIYDYVYQEFGQDAFLRLEEQVNATLKRLALAPFTFEALERKTNDYVRRAVVQTNTILIYEIDLDNQIIRVLSAFDARSNWK